MGNGAGRIALAAITAMAALLLADGAWAANGAYAVDSADISEVGSCKLESWISTATNTDFSLVANPSCVADVGRPVEFSLLGNRSRSDGDWSTSFQPKAKTNLVPTGVGRFGFAMYAGASFDVLTGDENSDENISIERLTGEDDISPIIRLVDTTIFTALERRATFLLRRLLSG